MHVDGMGMGDMNTDGVQEDGFAGNRHDGRRHECSRTGISSMDTS